MQESQVVSDGVNCNRRFNATGFMNQKGILAWSSADLVDQLVSNISELADAFHNSQLPVVWVHATGLPAGAVENVIPEPDELPEDFVELDERLPVHSSDIHLYKQRTWSAFAKTDLADQLRALGVDTVHLVGGAAGAGVESTARSAYDEGFNVHVIRDVIYDPNPARLEHSLQHDFPSFGRVTSKAELLKDLN